MLDTTTPNGAQVPPTQQAAGDDGFRDYLIAAIHCGRLRAQLLQNELNEIGVALKADLVSSEAAIYWLDEVGGLPFVDVGVASQ
jgi:hypothetical protein